MKRMGDRAWRVELPDGVDRASLLASLGSNAAVEDVVMGDRHVVIVTAAAADEVAAMFSAESRATAASGRLHVVEARYDGPDLDDVARAVGLTRDEVIALHAREYVVELVGFLPGFGYLGPLDPRLASVPRRGAPRPRVAAGSIGIAAGRTGIYPFDSPGGWLLVARVVDFVAFDAAHGSTLKTGDRVRFVAVD